jgi:hypothetical protein
MFSLPALSDCLVLCSLRRETPKLKISQEERGLISGPLGPRIAGGLVQRAPPLPVRRNEWEPQASPPGITVMSDVLEIKGDAGKVPTGATGILENLV